ncbi:MAG: PAS domain S-box protein [Limnobacter sp.]|nr:PAS domain S-box protein [Limnobacter sp.]
MPFNDQSRTSPVVWVTPLVGIILFILAMGAFFYTLHSEDQDQARLRTIRDVELARQSIRTRLLSLQERLSQLARSIDGADTDKALFQRQAKALLSDTPEMSSVAVLDTRRNIRMLNLHASSPLNRSLQEGSQVGGAETIWAFDSAKSTGLPVFSPPFLGPGNGVYMEIHSPAFKNDHFVGTVVATIPFTAMLNDAVPESFTKLYMVSIVDAQGKLIASNASRQIDRPKMSHEVVLSPPGHGLKLRAVLYKTSAELFSNMLAWTVLGLSALIVWSFILLYRHSKLRNQAEKQLLAETKFRRAMENSVITGMRAIDMDGRITYVNPAFCKMTGYRESELVGMLPPFPYWPEKSYRIQEEALRLILAGQAPRQGLEVQIRRRDGSVFDARMYVSPLVDSEGKQSGWMTSVTDITEPRRVREELAAAQKRFVRILEELDAAVVVEEPDAPTRPPIFTNRLHREWFAQAAPPIQQRIGGAQRGFEPFEWLNPVTQRWYEIRRRAILWVDGQTVIMQVTTDISSRKEAEQINRQQQEKLQFTSRLMTLGELASSLAHELNQPLTAIANYTTGGANRLKTGSVKPADLLPMLEKVNAQAQRAGDVIRRIREFVKQQEPNRSPCKIDTIIQDAIGFSKLEAKNHAATIEVNNPDPELVVMADAILIEQVLMNLIKNGIEAMANTPFEERRVLIQISSTPHFVLTEVYDRGAGVPEDIREKLFESFFTTKSNGMGMGLNICRTIIEYHQGQLWVESATGGGSVFKFTLPTHPKNTTPTQSGPSSKEHDA